MGSAARIWGRARTRGHHLFADERGAALSEYGWLIALIAVAVVVSAGLFGPRVADAIEDPGDELAGWDEDWEPGEPIGGSNNGWDLTPINEAPDKKNGQDVNDNGDDWVCVKDIPGNGNGNTGQGYNVKDNDGPLGDGGDGGDGGGDDGDGGGGDGDGGDGGGTTTTSTTSTTTSSTTTSTTTTTEPPEVNTPPSKNACKHGGWQDYTDENGEPFTNQGDCISWWNANN